MLRRIENIEQLSAPLAVLTESVDPDQIMLQQLLLPRLEPQFLPVDSVQPSR